MKRLVPIAITCMLPAFGALAQSQRPTPPQPPVSSAQARPAYPAQVARAEPVPTSQPSGVKTELDRLMQQLSQQAGQVEALAKKLGETTKITPQQTVTQVDAAAKTLAELLDKIGDNSDIAGQMKAIRNATNTHRARVAEMPTTLIDEADKDRILKAWERIAKQADEADVSMGNMRDSLQTALNRATKKRTALSELLVASQYDDAVASYQAGVKELMETAKTLNGFLGRAEPAM